MLPKRVGRAQGSSGRGGNIRALHACAQSYARTLRFTQLTAPLEAEPGYLVLLSSSGGCRDQSG